MVKVINVLTRLGVEFFFITIRFIILKNKDCASWGMETKNRTRKEIRFFLGVEMFTINLHLKFREKNKYYEFGKTNFEFPANKISRQFEFVKRLILTVLINLAV